MQETQKDSFVTLPGLLEYIYSRYKDSACMSYRRREGWETLTTAEVYNTVRFLTLALHDLGLNGNSIGIIAHPSPFWVITDLAILASGNITVPIFKRISAESMKHETEDSGTEYIFIGMESELEMVRQYGKGIKKIIPLQIHAKGEDILDYQELIRRGREIEEKKPDLFTQLIDKVKPDNLATIIYTSGSTGKPKGVELSHRNIVTQVHAAGRRFPLQAEQDIALSSLPLAHIFERMVMYFYLSAGVPVYFVDDLEKIGERARDVRPTIMTVVPRLLEKVFGKMRENAEEKSGLSGRLARGAFDRAVSKPVDEPVSGLSDFLYRKLVFPKFLQGLGGRFRMVISGAAPLPPEIGRFFLNIGLPVYEGYGLTEASPVIAANYPGRIKLGTVGLPFPGVDVKISEEGEVLAKGPNIMQGYHNNPAATKETIDKEGFLHTGDLGSMEDGNLKITGRKKNLFKKSTGEYVAPIPIEQSLRRCPYIDMAMIIADSRRFVSALLFPDFDKLEQLRAELNMQAAGREEFLRSRELRDKIQKCIDETNSRLHHTEEVQKFIIISEPPAIESQELTPTMKIKRNVIEEKYRSMIDELYKEEKDQ